MVSDRRHRDPSALLARPQTQTDHPLAPLAVTLGGATLFLLFGLVYTYEAWYWVEPSIEAGLSLGI